MRRSDNWASCGPERARAGLEAEACFKSKKPSSALELAGVCPDKFVGEAIRGSTNNEDTFSSVVGNLVGLDSLLAGTAGANKLAISCKRNKEVSIIGLSPELETGCCLLVLEGALVTPVGVNERCCSTRRAGVAVAKAEGSGRRALADNCCLCRGVVLSGAGATGGDKRGE